MSISAMDKPLTDARVRTYIQLNFQFYLPHSVATAHFTVAPNIILHVCKNIRNNIVSFRSFCRMIRPFYYLLNSVPFCFWLAVKENGCVRVGGATHEGWQLWVHANLRQVCMEIDMVNYTIVSPASAQLFVIISFTVSQTALIIYSPPNISHRIIHHSGTLAQYTRFENCIHV